MSRGLIIAAAASGSGKTVFTLGLLAALKARGLRPASAKVGPDYIDAAFHTAAGGQPCRSLDVWAMRRDTLAAEVARLAAAGDPVIVEGVMGLFDGALVAEGDCPGSTADLAAITGWPVILLVDLKGQSASAAALVDGFARHRAGLPLAGVVFNRVGGPGHRAAVEAAVAATCPRLPRLGWLPRHPALALPERHLGLVQAGETAELPARIAAAAEVIAEYVDIDRLVALARPSPLAAPAEPSPPLPPLGQTIAVARDQAFAFAYPSILAGWRQAGAELSFFSPLADEAPAPAADAVFLPGGYPELHAGRLGAAGRFLGGLRRAAAAGAWIYGECGGYMTLGTGLEDADGHRHAMAGLLPVETSFARRRLHLGYRRAELVAATPLGDAGRRFRGHEFHYATVTAEGEGEPLFLTGDAAGGGRGSAGRRVGRVMGSFVHLLDNQDS
ncbi:MAG TPA: cobyrinate a,c-diamide synthase [Rhodospirillaceae bacterium]|nr:cobyrinate a,c-diamide synthase [Rhodospirillaceae bacterium]